MTTNKDKILGFLARNKDSWFDDDVLSVATSVRPRQQIYQLCTRLAQDGIIDRAKVGPKLKNRWKSQPGTTLRRPTIMADRKVVPPVPSSTKVSNWDETRFQDGLFQALCQKIGRPRVSLNPASTRFPLSTKYGGGHCEKEGELHLAKASGTHKADILIRNGSQKLIAVEIKKFGSSVTDVFKARAFDAYHMKESLGDHLQNVLVYFYLKGRQSTLSIERARELSYWQDFFIGIDVERDELWYEPVRTIENILAGWNGGSEVSR